MPMPSLELKPLERRDVPAAGALLARAFCENPAYNAILSHVAPGPRVRTLTHVKSGFVRATRYAGTALAAWNEGRLVGASLVFPPGHYPLGPFAWIVRGWGCLWTGPRGLRNLLRADGYLSRTHLESPHFYLFVLGVEPELQGRGIGRVMLEELNQRADAARQPCYLETDKPSSVHLYESVGYRVVAEEEVAEVPGLKFWRMQRPPTSR